MAGSNVVELRHGDLACRLAGALEPGERDEVARFVAGSPAASHHQMPVWPGIVPLSPLHHYRFLTCRRDGRLVMSGVLRFTRVLPGRFLVNLPRGPVVLEPGHLDEGIGALVRIVRQAGGISLVVNPRWPDDAMDTACGILARHGFSPSPEHDQKMHTSTGLIDLTPEPAEIFAGFKQRCRRSIRTGEKAGPILHRLAPGEDLRPYDDLWRVFVRRKGFDASGIPDLPGQVGLAEALGGVSLALEHQDECIGLLTSVRHGDRGFFLAAASSDRHPAIPKTYLLLWHSLLIMRDQGCRTYDLAGMPDHEARDEDERNRMQFKEAFNPRHVRLCARHARVLRPVEHALCSGLLHDVKRLRRSIRRLADTLPWAGRPVAPSDAGERTN